MKSTQSDLPTGHAVKPFLLIHIRKTAGTSLRSLLVNQFSQSRILANAHSVSGPQSPGDNLFVTGHVDLDYASRFSIRPTIIAVLREPVSLGLSAYYFFRGNDEPFFQSVVKDWTAADYESRRQFASRAQLLDLRRFLTEEESLARRWLSNPQTRHLAGPAFAELDADDPRLLQAALGNLDRCDLIGLVERLPDTLLLLGRLMRWGRLGPLAHVNRTAGRPEVSETDPKCIEILRAWNAMDFRLYEAGSRLFEDKMKALTNDPAEPLLDMLSLPDAQNFTPETTIRGYGWHQREFHQDRWLCWNSDTMATLCLRVTGGRPSRFRCRLSHVISAAALDRLRISLNAVPLQLATRWEDGDVVLEAPIPAQAFEASPGLVALTFDCPVMQKPCDVNPASPDRRSLGVAVASICIE